MNFTASPHSSNLTFTGNQTRPVLHEVQHNSMIQQTADQLGPMQAQVILYNKVSRSGLRKAGLLSVGILHKIPTM